MRKTEVCDVCKTPGGRQFQTVGVRSNGMAQSSDDGRGYSEKSAADAPTAEAEDKGTFAEYP